MINAVNLSGIGAFTVPTGVSRIFVRPVSLGPRSPRGQGSGANVNVLRYGGALSIAWGGNSQGNVGDGTTTNRSTPVLIAGGHTFIDASVGSFRTTALKGDGSAWGWGINANGMLGDGTNTNKSTPTAVIGGHTFIQVFSNNNITFGLKADGTIWGWGANAQGQIGDGTNTPKSSPVQVIGNTRFREIVSIPSGGGPTFAFGMDGLLYSWGANTAGQLGDGTIDNRSSPVAVLGGRYFKQVNYASSWAIAIDELGDAYAWGDNGNGRLGDGTTNSRSSPTAMAGGHKFSQVMPFAGAFANLMLKPDGTAWACGQNAIGVLGDGTITAKSTPTAVLGGHSFSKIILNGNGTVLAMKPNGSLWGWSANAAGQIGDGTIATKSTPTAVLGGHVFVDAFTVGSSSYAIKSDGTIWAWGDNAQGQLGDNTIANKSTPTAVVGGALLYNNFPQPQPPFYMAPNAGYLSVTPGSKIPFETGMVAGFGQLSYQNVDYFLVEY